MLTRLAQRGSLPAHPSGGGAGAARARAREAARGGYNPPVPTTPAPRPSRSARLARIAAAELAESAVLLAMLAVVVTVLAGALHATGAAEHPLAALWSPSGGTGAPFAPRLLSALAVTATLAGGGLAIAATAATLLGWLSLVSPAVERVRGFASAASAVPLVAGGAVVQHLFGNHLAGPVLLVAATEMTLGSLAAQVRAEMAKELARDYVDTARGAGRAAFFAYWRALAAIAIAAARPRIPHLLGATIVVERIFALEADGLADLVFSGIERRGDPAVLAWVAALGLGIVRLARLLEALVLATLDPRRDAPLDAPDAAPPSPWMPARPALAARDAWEALGDVPAAMARTASRAVRGVRARARRLAHASVSALVGSALWTAVTTAAALCVALVLSGWLPAEGSGAPRPHAPPDWSAGSYLGADALGRDLATQLLRAGRNMAGPLALAIALPLVLGAATGAAAACGTRRVRRWIGRAAELVESVPRLVVLLAVLWAIPVDGRYVWTVLATVGLSFWPLCHAAVEDRVRRAATDGFLEAQRALGASAWRAYGIHALWRNGRSALAVQAASIAGHVLMMETTLAYLGYSQPDEDLATWGKLVAFGLAEPPPASGPWNPWARWAPIACVSLACIAASRWGDLPGRAAERDR